MAETNTPHADVPRKQVWYLRVDIHVLDADGNLADAVVLSALAALLSFRRPDVSVGGADGRWGGAPPARAVTRTNVTQGCEWLHWPHSCEQHGRQESDSWMAMLLTVLCTCTSIRHISRSQNCSTRCLIDSMVRCCGQH